MDLTNLQRLKKLDEMREIPSPSAVGNLLVHRDHRWLLPMIHAAQQQGLLPTPTNLVMFDAHHDALEPTSLDRLQTLRAAGFTTADLIDLCEDGLRKLDDDWLLAGMHLGIIGDAVVFGVHDWSDTQFPKLFKDADQADHRIEILGIPGRELEYQGSLSDLAQQGRYERAWSILGWKHTPGRGFELAPEPKLVLDFDLDCFALRWHDYVLPWPDEIFAGEFLAPSKYFSTEGWTGRDFVLGLAAKAGLISVATEPNHCGGEAKAAEIMDRLLKLVL